MGFYEIVGEIEAQYRQRVLLGHETGLIVCDTRTFIEYARGLSDIFSTSIAEEMISPKKITLTFPHGSVDMFSVDTPIRFISLVTKDSPYWSK